MIETQFFVMESDMYEKVSQMAKDLNVSIDYLLLEFCVVEGEVILLP